MPDWLLIVAGLFGGLVLVYAIIWTCLRLDSRPSKHRGRLAERSGEWDNGHGLGGGVDPS